jgi:hypothetical protein
LLFLGGVVGGVGGCVVGVLGLVLVVLYAFSFAGEKLLHQSSINFFRLSFKDFQKSSDHILRRFHRKKIFRYFTSTKKIRDPQPEKSAPPKQISLALECDTAEFSQPKSYFFSHLQPVLYLTSALAPSHVKIAICLHIIKIQQSIHQSIPIGSSSNGTS